MNWSLTTTILWAGAFALVGPQAIRSHWSNVQGVQITERRTSEIVRPSESVVVVHQLNHKQLVNVTIKVPAGRKPIAISLSPRRSHYDFGSIDVRIRTVRGSIEVEYDDD